MFVNSLRFPESLMDQSFALFVRLASAVTSDSLFLSRQVFFVALGSVESCPSRQ